MPFSSRFRAAEDFSRLEFSIFAKDVGQVDTLRLVNDSPREWAVDRVGSPAAAYYRQPHARSIWKVRKVGSSRVLV